MTVAADLEPGTALPELRLPAITRATLALYAGGSGDHNPIHLDVDVARAAGAADVFAHGMLAMAYVGRLLTNWVAQEQIRTLAARFVAVTPVGAELTCRAAVTAVERNDVEVLATLALEVRSADGTLTMQGEATVALPESTEYEWET